MLLMDLNTKNAAKGVKGAIFAWSWSEEIDGKGTKVLQKYTCREKWNTRKWEDEVTQVKEGN